MSIKQLSIENYKSLKSINIDLNRRMNVFVGENGSGKSSILQTIEILFSWYNARFRSATAKGRLINPYDITHGEAYSRIHVKLNYPNEEEHISWQLIRHKNTRSNKNAEKSDFSAIKKIIDKVSSNNILDSNLPAFIVAYNVNRSVIDIPMRFRSNKRDAKSSLYEDELLSGANFKTFFNWFKQREDIENENIRFQTGGEDFQLHVVRKALENFFPNYRNLRVRRQTPCGVVLEKGDELLFLNQLSDGEKCYITMIADIARRMAVAYEEYHLSGDPLGINAIILIDEVELHLHPKWQLEILNKLKSTFTQCQFIVTTHSPHVIANVNSTDDYLFIMKEGNINRYSNYTYGVETNTILNEIFDMPTLRNMEVEALIQKVWEHLNNREMGKQFEEDYNKLKRLLPPYDHIFSLIKAQIMINESKRGKK